MGDRCHPGVGRRRCLLVGRHPHALEGCAGGGGRCPSWFQHDGLSMVVGVRVGGGSSLAMGACRSWVHGWGIVVVGRESLSMGGLLSVCTCGRCWWSPLSSGGGGCHSWWWSSSTSRGCRGLVVIERWWPLSLSEAVGLAAERDMVVVFGWLGCTLVVIGGMVEVVVAVGWVVRGWWHRFHGSCLFGSGR